ncbi:hypothetical protein L596_022309 [Steinernema carpocapsae]|uniref:Protein kinase domain-containing protein n=1 Tax=Steinernema carpocapsae TaxID=34508 RepID=A0A4U5MLE8_STECR|nr:hypothetical protein L596_022309 [Steinernema carpocapsae]
MISQERDSRLNLNEITNMCHLTISDSKESVAKKGSSLINRRKKPFTKSKVRLEDEQQQQVELDANGTLVNGTAFKGQRRIYNVVCLLGSGGFGDVYLMSDAKGFSYAMKTERVNETSKMRSRLKMEISVYQKVKEQKRTKPETVAHLLFMYDHGRTTDFRWFVMTFTGKSIEDKIKLGKISFRTAVRLSIETFEGITELHKLGFIHRDIKPANHVVGYEKKRCTVYLMDHGMASVFATDLKDVPEQSQYKFLGTMAYAPRASHLGKPQCRRDDLESWLYMCLEFFKLTNLAWSEEADPTECYKMKQQFFGNPRSFQMTRVPDCFFDFTAMLDKIGIIEEPDYEKFREPMRQLANGERLDFTEKFEWDGADDKKTRPKLRVAKTA